MGVVHRASPDWGSHIPVLVKALEVSEGPVLELGMGMFSTPLLHSLCLDQDRTLWSYENDARFANMFRNFRAPHHNIELVDNWNSLDLSRDWSVALVDHKPALQRREDVKRLTTADYVIIHDSQERPDEYYGYEEIYPLFRYRYDYTKFANQTTVLSNKHDVQDIFHNPLTK